MNLNTLSQLIYEEIIQHSQKQCSETDQSYLYILMGLRNILISNGDPLIRMNVGNVSLSMNLSHQLPLLRALHPAYDTALPRIVKAICAQEHAVKVIDIGANIGDTAASIAQEVTGSFLCIEGDKHYFSLLQENVKLINAQVVCVNAICGASDHLAQGYFLTEHGTGHFVAETDQGMVQLTSVKTVLENNVNFKDANLLKVDTDGFDTFVLRGAQKFLADTGPTVFTEYVPALITHYGEDPLAIFSYLSDLGYRYGLFYTNLGVPLEVIDICDQQKLTGLLARIDQINIGYYDILLPGRNLTYEWLITFYQHEATTVQKILSHSAKTA